MLGSCPQSRPLSCHAVKLGQHVAMLDHLVPAEYVQTMRRHMLNRCPVSTWEEVASIVREDLGAPPEKLFASFSPAPLASASLAQVHEATGFDGRRLAVKVGWHGVRSMPAGGAQGGGLPAGCEAVLLLQGRVRWEASRLFRSATAGAHASARESGSCLVPAGSGPAPWRSCPQLWPTGAAPGPEGVQLRGPHHACWPHHHRQVAGPGV